LDNKAFVTDARCKHEEESQRALNQKWQRAN